MKIKVGSLNHIKKDVKTYKEMGYVYLGSGKGYFKNGRSLKCGCSSCKAETAFKRAERRKTRHNINQHLKTYEYLHTG